MMHVVFSRAVKLAAPIALLSLAACATPFRADVSRFQQMPAPQGQTFTIKPADPANASGLEFAQYASLVTNRMTAQGYTQAADPAAANLTITLDYGVDQGKERTVVERDPFYDPWWGYGRYGGFYGRGFYGRPRIIRTPRGYGYIHGWNDPFLYGGGIGFGGGYQERSFTVYSSDLNVKITRNTDGQSVFEGKAEAKSRSNKLPYLIPNLVETMFTGFPGNSGETVRISVAPEKKK